MTSAVVPLLCLIIAAQAFTILALVQWRRPPLQRTEPTGMPRVPSTRPGPLVTMAFAAALVACHDTKPATTAANSARLAGHASAATLHKLCTEPYERASTLPPAESGAEIMRLDRMGCMTAARAHDALVSAHEALHKSIEAVDAGQCTHAAPVGKCDPLGAARDVVRAAVDLAQAVKRVEEEASR